MGNNFSAVAASAPTGESTLSVTRDDLRRYVRRYLGISRTGSLDTDDESDVADIVKAAERWVYVPEVLPGESVAHVWSWATPLLTISLTAPYSTGTVSITNGTVTLTGGTWPSWAADGTLVIEDGRYEVDTRTSGSVIVLEDTTVTGVSGETYELEHWRYTLPDGFSAFMDNSLSYSEGDNVWHSVALTGTGEVLQKRQITQVSVDTHPELAAVNVVSNDQTGGTRYELLLWPTPQSTYSIIGKYWVNPNAVSSGAPYPMGGMPLADLFVAAALASAEFHMNNARGEQYANFLSRLRAAIAFDRKMNAPKWLGSMNKSRWRVDPLHNSQELVTYNGTVYDGS